MEEIKYFKNLVEKAYSNPDGEEYAEILKIRKNTYRLNTEIEQHFAKMLGDLVYYAQKELYNEGLRKHLGFNPIMFKSLKVECSTDSVHESQTYLSKFDDEFMVFFLYQKLLNEKSVCIDVGGNVGTHSMVLSEICNKGKIYSIEPSDYCIEKMKSNFSYNKTSIVEIVQTLLSSEIKKHLFSSQLDNFNKGVGHITTNVVEDCLTLESNTIDNLFANQKIDLIKIDVEGHELEVLKGAQKTLSDNKPNIIIEYNKDHWRLENLLEVIPYNFSIHMIPNLFDEKIKSVKDDNEIGSRFTNLYIKPKTT